LLSGKVSTFAGGISGWQDGPLAKAKFSRPTGMAVHNGHIFVIDEAGIRLITSGIFFIISCYPNI
jgi:hypothetical protein